MVRRGSGAALDQPDQAPEAASLSSANGTMEAASEEAAATAQRGAANGLPSVPVPQSLPMPSSGLHFARVCLLISAHKSVISCREYATTAATQLLPTGV